MWRSARLLVQQLRAAGTQVLCPPAQQDAALAQLAAPLPNGVQRQVTIIFRAHGHFTLVSLLLHRLSPLGCGNIRCPPVAGEVRAKKSAPRLTLLRRLTVCAY